jgi:hypothetical protein
MSTTVVHEPSFHRFRIELDGRSAVLTYRPQGATIVFVHTEVPAAMEGKGIGGQLAKAGLEYARENQLKVVPRCPFVASYLRRHPEYEDVVASE